MVKNGRYGPYVSHNGVNATLTGDKTPDTVTLDEAIVLLDARAAMMGNSPEGPPRRRPQDRLRQGRGLTRRQAEETRRRQTEESRGRRQSKAGAPHQGHRRRVASEASFPIITFISIAPFWRRKIYFEQTNQTNTLPPLQG